MVHVEDLKSSESNLSDKAAALYNVFFALGSVAGPPLGGGLYGKLGWHESLLIVAAMALFSAFIYLLISLLCRKN